MTENSVNGRRDSLWKSTLGKDDRMKDTRSRSQIMEDPGTLWKAHNSFPEELNTIKTVEEYKCSALNFRRSVLE